MKIYEFEYNGFMGTCNEDKIMDYDVVPLSWTKDPGVFLGKCSDEKYRLIPAYAVVGGLESPEVPVMERIYFGIPSTSEMDFDLRGFRDNYFLGGQ